MRFPGSRAVAGASILAAGASIPLHLLPVLVLALSADGRLDAAHAGWVGSAYMLGQLAMALVLPLARVTRVRWGAACGATLAMLAGAILSDSRSVAVLLGCWFFVGAFGCSLHYLATTTAAASPDRRYAFAIRMGTSSALGSCLIMGLQVFRPAVDYAAIVGLYVIATSVVGSVGLALLAGQGAASATAAPTPAVAAGSPASGPGVALLTGLGALFILFVGQHGLWAFAVKGATQRGLPIAQLLWAVALCKMAGAAMVWATARTGLATPGASMRIPGVAVAIGGATVAFAPHAAPFCIGLLLWEIGFNILSARFQASLAQQDPRRAGMWITAALFLGAATGPALAGVALGMGAFPFFAVIAAATALLPSLWAARATPAPVSAATPA